MALAINKWVSITEGPEAILNISDGFNLATGDDDVDLALNGFKVYQRQRKKGLAASGKVGPFFKGEGSYQNIELEYMAAMFSNKSIETEVGSGVVVRRYGFGIRVSLVITEVRAKMKLNFSAIAATAELGLLNAKYSIQGFGLDNPTILSQFKLGDLIGNFDFESYKAIIDLVEKLKEYMSKNTASLKLVPIEVLSVVPVKGMVDIADARKYYFAVKYLTKNQSLEELIGQIRSRRDVYMDEGVCKFVYKYFRVDNGYSSPTPLVMNAADRWLEGESIGRIGASELSWIPISSNLTKDGEFEALPGLKPHTKEMGFDGGYALSVFVSQSSRSYSSELKLASMGTLDGGFDEETIFMDTVFYRDITVENGAQPIGNTIYGTRYGIGIRFIIQLRNIEFGIDVESGNIGAIIELGLADAEYELTGIGINDESLFKLFPGPIDLNNDTFEKILESLNQIGMRIANLDESEIDSQPLMIWVKDPGKVDPLDYQRHVTFCQKCVMNRIKLGEAITKGHERGLSEEKIRKIYGDEFDIDRSDQRVPRTKSTVARKWLDV